MHIGNALLKYVVFSFRTFNQSTLSKIEADFVHFPSSVFSKLRLDKSIGLNN